MNQGLERNGLINALAGLRHVYKMRCVTFPVTCGGIPSAGPISLKMATIHKRSFPYKLVSDEVNQKTFEGNSEGPFF